MKTVMVISNGFIRTFRPHCRVLCQMRGKSSRFEERIVRAGTRAVCHQNKYMITHT